MLFTEMFPRNIDEDCFTIVGTSITRPAVDEEELKSGGNKALSIYRVLPLAPVQISSPGIDSAVSLHATSHDYSQSGHKRYYPTPKLAICSVSESSIRFGCTHPH